MMASRPEPIVIEPTDGRTANAAIIFIHGLGDEGETFASIAGQFQAASKLPHVKWIFPTALEDRDLMQRAWYTPSPLSPFPSQRPELDDPEDEDGLKRSRTYIEGLVDEVVVHGGIPLDRIIVGGFSQGCAVSLLVALTSGKLAGRLAGIAGFAGYLPLVERIPQMRGENGLSETVDDDVPFLITRGSRDMLVPKRYLRQATGTLLGLGVKEEMLEVHEYDGIGHALSGTALRDFCKWAEKSLHVKP